MLRSKYEAQLMKLNDELTQMGELCVTAIVDSTEALKTTDKNLAQKIILEDDEIDQLEKAIERRCLKLLLRQQPVACDLRQISATLKMITDMERIGDQTADIAEIILSSEHLRDLGEIKRIEKMSKMAAKMVKDSLVAFTTKDLELTKSVMQADDEIDVLYDEVKFALVDLITDDVDKKEKLHKEVAIDLIIVAKYLERIADHATNIAEWVEFSITGVHPDTNETKGE